MRSFLTGLVAVGLLAAVALPTGCGRDPVAPNPAPANSGAADTNTGAAAADTGGMSHTSDEFVAIHLPALSMVWEGRFATSRVCSICHRDAPRSDALQDSKGRSVAHFELWRSTMMANAARDPLFRAQLSIEMVATPSISGKIQEKCLGCHAPMATRDAHDNDEKMTLDTLFDGSLRSQLGIDGVSCTLCHQIKPHNFGDEESYTGGFIIGRDRAIHGPHANPMINPMAGTSTYRPVHADHILESTLCATCHTLETEAHLPDGTPTGKILLEQSPYLEWLNSVFNTGAVDRHEKAQSCQGCHVPQTDLDGNPIRTRIAHPPGGGRGGMWGTRDFMGRHIFVGGNTLIPAILRDNREELRPNAPDRAFDATIAAARHQLQNQTATLELSEPTRTGDALELAITVTNLAGHKFPSAYPARRAWLRVQVTAADGSTVFTVGQFDMNGRIVGADGKPLPFETAGGPIQAHLDRIEKPGDVVIYESVMADVDHNATFILMRGAEYAKDTRLLPEGWQPDYPDASRTAPVGTFGDLDFVGGSDTVQLRVNAPEAAGPYRVQVDLLYQTLSARTAAEIFTYNTREVKAFKRYYEAADRRPETVATITTDVP